MPESREKNHRKGWERRTGRRELNLFGKSEEEMCAYFVLESSMDLCLKKR